MNFDLSEDQISIRDAVRELCEREFAPHAARWDQEEIVPREAVDQLAKQGFLGMGIAEAWGGVGYDYRTISVVIEEIARVSAALAIMIAVHNSVGAMPIWRFGSDAQKKRFMPRLVTKELGAFCLSEPGAGSDAASIESYAVRDGDSYVLHGAKNWVTNGSTAGSIILFARTDPDGGNKGITAFVITPDLPGFSVGKHEDKMGLRASVTTELALQDCRVPVANRLGEEGQGFKIAMATLDGGRIGIAAQAVGIAVAAYEAALGYARERKSFGVPIGQHQMVQWMLADMATGIEAARLLTLRAASLKDRGEPHGAQAAMAKLFASETAMRVATDAVQIHGGYGFIKEYQVERHFRDA